MFVFINSNNFSCIVEILKFKCHAHVYVEGLQTVVQTFEAFVYVEGLQTVVQTLELSAELTADYLNCIRFILPSSHQKKHFMISRKTPYLIKVVP